MTRRFALLFLFLFVAACSSVGIPNRTLRIDITASPTAAAFPPSVTDFQGRWVAILKRPERIVSIGPSNTEFLFALGAGDRVVGDDDFSDEPAAAKTKDHVGGVKVNLEKVVSLKPDLIVTVKFSDGTIEALTQTSASLIVVDPQSAADAAPKPKVFHEVDASDLTKMYTVGPGSFIDDLIKIAGGTNIAAGAKTQYPTISAEEVVKADPEIVVLGDSAYGTTGDAVAARPGWSAISAVKNKRVYPVPGNLFSRPGPRLGDAAEAYARLVHPELFK